MGKRIVLILSLLLVASFMIPFEKLQAAEKYPAKPIIFLVPNEAGSSADTGARVLAGRLQAQLGQPVVVTNKPGAGSSIGNRELHNAKPDGYTIGMSTATIFMNKLQGLLPYDHNDYTVLGAYLNWAPAVMASTKTKRPFNTMQEVIAAAKSRPGEIILSTGSVGQVWWVAAMDFIKKTGLEFNVVPQTSSSAATVLQVAGGHADIGITDVTTAKSQIDAGNIKVLALLGSERLPNYPAIPTLKEVGYNSVTYSTHLALAPPNMPKEITEKLLKAFEKAANDAEFKSWVTQNNGIPSYMTPEQTVKWMNDQVAVYREIMGKAGILKEK
ncbi:MAG: tripartite tricarboxylate transporter substrate binding protein [Deltaproteobacteria bacterium]|nr:tripartite tricarboxylate transporter substrate binding protein [Deltaproteobacteria bacterium]